MTETTIVQAAHLNKKNQRIKMALEIKLSKAQEKALVNMLENEYRAYKIQETGDHRAGFLARNYGVATCTALIAKGVLSNDNDTLGFTPIGRELAIALLIEPGRKEMEAAFEARDDEAKRKALQWVMKTKIMKAYHLENHEITVHAHMRLRRLPEVEYRYSVAFPLKVGEDRDGKPRYNDRYVAIDYRNLYYVNTSSSSFEYHGHSRRVAELMLIAVQIIESGLLEANTEVEEPVLTWGQQITLGMLSKHSMSFDKCRGNVKIRLQVLADYSYCKIHHKEVTITEAGRAILNRSQ